MITTDKAKVRSVITQISDAMTRIEAERSFINEAVKDAADKHQIEKKLLRKMARVYHKNNFTEEKTSAEEFVEMYDNVCK